MSASACPACGGVGGLALPASDRMHLLPGMFASRRCTVCGSLFLDPVPSPETLAAHYPDGYAAWGDKSSPPPPPRGLRRVARRALVAEGPFGGVASRGLARLTGIETFALVHGANGPWAVLDVGCGNGITLDSYARLGWRTAGVDAGERAVALARARGHDAVAGFFPETAPAGPFGLVLLVHSLEHLPDPVAALRRARELLAPGGRVFVATPNAGGALARRFGEHWWQIDAPRHLVVLTAAGLRAAGTRAGLVVERLHTHSVPMGPLVSRRLARDPGFCLEDWRPGREAWAGLLRAYAGSLLRDLGGRGDNLHAVLAADGR